ncbi:monofunctional biosynthetic peptidoglycan transglycosylase [Amaricoccus macauensis]|uniref:monofunctional biosynthetic peptidoglycan transglycosylase n=1 Tax=Amaricoccus macauensis TaxID=57001 RepID=UPI003C7A1984
MKRLLRRIGRWLLGALLVLAALAVCSVLLYRWINPPLTWLMVSEWRRLGQIERQWVPLETMSAHVPRSAAAAEDANFCRHWGFDLDGIRAALADSSRLRGGSTISQQTAKNVFLWPDRTWTRKGLEAGFTLLIETLWSKERIMEVYLNVAEFDEGVFGVQAAAQEYWGLDAAELGPLRSGRLMAVLPNPKDRSPVSGDPWVNARGARIQNGAATIRVDGRAACFS